MSLMVIASADLQTFMPLGELPGVLGLWMMNLRKVRARDDRIYLVKVASIPATCFLRPTGTTSLASETGRLSFSCNLEEAWLTRYLEFYIIFSYLN